MFRVIFYIELHTLGSESMGGIGSHRSPPQILIFVAMLMPILLLKTPAAPTHTCTNMQACPDLTVPKIGKENFQNFVPFSQLDTNSHVIVVY